jgi:hypothetical protein
MRGLPAIKLIQKAAALYHNRVWVATVPAGFIADQAIYLGNRNLAKGDSKAIASRHKVIAKWFKDLEMGM